MRALTRTLALALALTPAAQAGDRPQVVRVAFSPGGAQVLAVTGWVADGSGFPSASLSLLDTASGRLLHEASAQHRQGQLNGAQVRASLLASNAAQLRLAGVAGRPDSRPKFARPWTARAPQWGEALAAGQSRTTPVVLWSKAVPVTLSVRHSTAPCAYRGLLPPGEGPATFTLKVNTQLLRTPASPAVPCAARYALERVDLSGNRVLVTVRAYGPGFEGPNATPIFIAATLR